MKVQFLITKKRNTNRSVSYRGTFCKFPSEEAENRNIFLKLALQQKPKMLVIKIEISAIKDGIENGGAFLMINVAINLIMKVVYVEN